MAKIRSLDGNRWASRRSSPHGIGAVRHLHCCRFVAAVEPNGNGAAAAKPVKPSVAPLRPDIPDPEVMARVLGEVARALDRAGMAYGVIGGIASAGYGRPRWTHDIDILVRPEDAARALTILAADGFDTEL